jgi:hypothetical protein
MSTIKAEVPKGFKDRVEETRKSRGISESELVRTAVKNYLDNDNVTRLTPLQRAWGKDYKG